MRDGDEYGWAHYALQKLGIRFRDFAEMEREEKLLTIASCAVQLEEETKMMERFHWNRGG